MAEEPNSSSLHRTIYDNATTLVRGISSTPQVLAILSLNTVMIIGWLWLFVKVGAQRAAEYDRLVTLLEQCMKGH